MKTICTLALAALCAFGTAGTAHAALYVPASASSSTTDSNASTTEIGDWTQTVQLQKFNTALGTLHTVTFTLSGDMQVEFYAQSNQAAPQTVTNVLQAALTATLPTLTGPSLAFSDSVSYTLDGFAADTRTLGGSDGDSLQLFSNWDAFVGAGLFDVVLNASSTSAGTAGGNVDDLTLPSSSARISVRYDYTATNRVPEPASLALVALALAASALTARRRT